MLTMCAPHCPSSLYAVYLFHDPPTPTPTPKKTLRNPHHQPVPYTQHQLPTTSIGCVCEWVGCLTDLQTEADLKVACPLQCNGKDYGI